MINVIVISDIKIYCEGLDQMLAGTSCINVFGAVVDKEAAIALITDRLPDVVLLDMTMAESCQLAQQIYQVSEYIKIVALAVPYNDYNILQCAEAGITGYVPREASIDELIKAVVGASKGECYCPPKIAACILKKVQDAALLANKKSFPTARENTLFLDRSEYPQNRLTRREQQIARLLSEGLSNKHIARHLSIEVSTVKNHVHNLLVKLEVSSRSQAVSLLQRSSSHPVSRSFDPDTSLNMAP